MDELQQIINYLAVRDSIPDVVNVILILGSSDIENPQVGANFYEKFIKKRCYPYILLSGGIGWNTPELLKNFKEFTSSLKLNTGDFIKQNLIFDNKFGPVIPEAVIYNYLLKFFLGEKYIQSKLLIDYESTNTGENIKNSIYLLEKNELLKSNIKLLIIENPYLELRAIQTLKRQLKDKNYSIQIFGYASYIPDVSIRPELCYKLASREYYRLRKDIYGSEGENFIEDIVLPKEIEEIILKIRKNDGNFANNINYN